MLERAVKFPSPVWNVWPSLQWLCPAVLGAWGWALCGVLQEWNRAAGAQPQGPAFLSPLLAKTIKNTAAKLPQAPILQIPHPSPIRVTMEGLPAWGHWWDVTGAVLLLCCISPLQPTRGMLCSVLPCSLLRAWTWASHLTQSSRDLGGCAGALHSPCSSQVHPCLGKRGSVTGVTLSGCSIISVLCCSQWAPARCVWSACVSLAHRGPCVTQDSQPEAAALVLTE